jgi:proteasome lid subunit RPN8/RPN11
MDPKAQLQVFKELETKKWDLLAIYHSHPNGPATPSQTDIAGATYPDAVNLIWSKNGRGWHCRAYKFLDGSYEQIPLTVDGP